MTVANVVHGLTNPLTSIGLLLESLQQQLRECEGTDRAQNTATRMEDILEQLRAFTRGLGNLARTDEAVGDIDLAESFEFALQLAGHELHERATVVTLLEQTPPVRGSRTHASQALVSLLLTAARAIPSGRPRGAMVRVSTGTDSDGGPVAEVSVTGPHARFLELPDALGSTTTDNATAFGLTFAEAVISELGGELFIDAEPGAGAWFRVRLPPPG